MARYAVLSPKFAGLETEFGRAWAEKLFGAEAIASLPVRTVGKNKGCPKGYVIWRKAIVAGWCREVSSPLSVGSLADAWIGPGPFASRDSALIGFWAGRRQSLAGSKSVLFGRAEADAAAERERFEAEMAELRAEAAAAKAATVVEA